MNVSLTPELEKIINQKVKSGMYGSASEVVRESLRRMFKEEGVIRPTITDEQRQQMEELRQEVLKGVEQIRNGEGISYDSPEELAKDIIKRGTQKLAERQKVKVTM